MKKTILSLLLSLGMCFGVFVAPVHAETIGSNQTVIGQTNNTDPITYTYTMPKSGYFYYTVSIQGNTYIYHGSESDEVREMYNDYTIYTSMKENYKTYIDNSGIDYDKPFTSGLFNFKQGSKVKIIISDTDEYSCKFALAIHYVNPKNFEKEGNNTRSQAMKINLNTTYNGLVGYKDSDWFVYKAKKTGNYKVYSTITKEERASVYTQVYRGYKLINSTSISEGDGWINLVKAYSGSKVKLKKGQKLYVNLSRSSSPTALYKFNVKKVK